MSASGGTGSAAREGLLSQLAASLRRELVDERRREAAAGSDHAPIEVAIAELVERRAAGLRERTRTELAERIRRETIGLGPLEPLLADPEVEEILVSSPERVHVERGGRLYDAKVSFSGEEELWQVLERILAPAGRRVDERSPMADARLPDGSRVNVVIPPIALDGPSVAIRRFGANRPGLDRLVAIGALDEPLRSLLAEAVRDRLTVVVSGGTGSGKTTMLNALSGLIDPAERVITIEDSAELRLELPHVVRLEARPPGIEGTAGIGIRDLVRNALRMRPDRLIIGEVRGAEAFELMGALNTGHAGSLTTVHANGPADALARLETLALMAAVDLPHRVIAEQLARAIDLVLHLERRPDGFRGASSLARVTWSGTGGTTESIWRSR